MQKIFGEAALRACRSPCRAQVLRSARKLHLPPLSAKNSHENTKEAENSGVAEHSSSNPIKSLPTDKKNETSGNDFASQLEAMYQARKAARLEEDAIQAATTETSDVTDKALTATDDKHQNSGNPQSQAEVSQDNGDRNTFVRRYDPRSSKTRSLGKKNEATSQDSADVVHSERVEDFTRMMSSHRESMVRAPTKKLKNIIVREIPARHTGNIRVISLDRAGVHNALSRDLLQELKDEVSLIHAEGDKGPTRCVVLASTSPGSFCAGADLKERRGMTTEAVQEYLATLRETFRLIFNLPVPCIAAVDGNALGGGAELALCAHMRVLGANAVFCMPETGLGIIPGAGGTYRLAEIIGQPKALEMILTRSRIQATTANEWGLGKYTYYDQRIEKYLKLDQAGLHDACLARSVSMALAITNGAPLAVRAAIQAMVPKDRPRGEVEENMAYDSLLETSDRKEALQAFAEKRFTVFKGE